ncbi:helix-turn-helix domain-containing protein [Ralstonia solanacearum]|uniref:helix-turn-helix domain-containing protein n=1 Tax=Ralstonia solanacearum TaxID=305 RepID=UPI002029E618|nr:helix-turn-helix transcriptional regulator [Ralstonia solanacearum]MCL9844624.1 helix-turn-helix domain-containing protein [Ralstonia solanacearum]MDC6253157.1 helix-turn-helix transcriptional regulator [Ralstonia solanacearum]MDC6257739.1 helix-turn-helix transcriptional regulator [Ralstonia solanacearum]MDC6301605.1 helix-turn-helix transcriptional regulator [Ralstonia solanacearum]
MSRQVQLKRIVGKLIAKKRKEAKLTQEDVAHLVNLSTEGYARYERGDSSPDVMFLAELAGVFKCTVVELMVETSTGLTAQAQHIANLLESVSTSDRDEIVKIVESCCALAHKKQKKTLKPY